MASTDIIAGNSLITSLRKKTLDGTLYARPAELEAQLSVLAALPREELIARCAIRRRDQPGYVPSECLLYFVRARRSDNSDAFFEQLYKLLIERVYRRLPTAESADGTSQSMTKTAIREKVLDRFVELLADDRNLYSEKLDYFEIRFDGALTSLRRDAQKQAWRDENRTVSLQFDEETAEPSAEVEEAAGSFDQFNSPENDCADYRLRFDQAIDALPTMQGRIIEMLRKGILIDSIDANAVTIAKSLGKSEKTIRNHRDKAFASLRATLTGGEK